MINVNFSGYANYQTDNLTQWDTGQVMNVTGLNFYGTPTVLFSNKISTVAEPVTASYSDGVLSCEIPNDMLTKPYPIYAYIRVKSGNTYTVVARIRIPVEPAKVPADYQYIENISIVTYEDIMNKLDEIENNEVRREVLKTTIENYIAGLIDDGTMAGLTIPDGSITKEKLDPSINLDLEDGSVTAYKLSGVSVIEGIGIEFTNSALNETTGAIVTLNNYQVTTKIPVKSGTNLPIGGYYKNYNKNIFGIAYDKDDNFAGKIVPPDTGKSMTYSVPGNATYIRLVLHMTADYLPTNVDNLSIGNPFDSGVGAINTTDETIGKVIGQYAGSHLPDKSVPFSALNLFDVDYYNKILWHTRIKKKFGDYLAPEFYSDIPGEKYYANGTYLVDFEPGTEYRYQPTVLSKSIFFIFYSKDGDYLGIATDENMLKTYCSSYSTETINYATYCYFILNENIGNVYYCRCSNAADGYGTTERNDFLCKKSEYDAGRNITDKSWKCVSPDFADAMSNINGVERYPSALRGKVAVFLGDSYTAGMKDQLSAMCEKFGMIADNRGIVSSSVSGDTTGNRGFSPMWSRADGIVNDYTNGYTINGTTYNIEDVAVIVFMGGANDGFGPATWIGPGLNDTDTLHIYGATKHILNVLMENFTGAKVITVLQPSSYNRTVSSVTDDDTAMTMGFANLAELQKMSDVEFSNYAMALKENAIEEVARAYQSEIVDCFHDYPTIFNPANRSLYWASDKLHLTGAGYYIITNAIREKITELFSD